jgi:1-phosphofructokinase
MTPTLFTLTGNLLWERTLDFATWSPGKTQRARSESFQVGGKGINVSRMLKRLGAPTKALCFAGGSTGADCLAWLAGKGIDCHAFPTTAATRSGTVVRSDQPETTFLGPDAAPDENAWAACAGYLDALPNGQVLALCGSFPGWSTSAASPLQAALTRWATCGILVADTYGPPLAWALQQPLALVKINRDEFDALYQPASSTEPFASRLAAAFAVSRASAWIVTDGGEPVWYVDRACQPRSFIPRSVALVSPTGSGDVLLACILHAAFQRGLSLPEALNYALPFAAANAASPGIAEFDLNNLPA